MEGLMNRGKNRQASATFAIEPSNIKLTLFSNILLGLDFPGQSLLQLQTGEQWSPLLSSDILDHEGEGIPRLADDIRMRRSEEKSEINEVKVGEVIEIPVSQDASKRKRISPREALRLRRSPLVSGRDSLDILNPSNLIIRPRPLRFPNSLLPLRRRRVLRLIDGFEFRKTAQSLHHLPPNLLNLQLTSTNLLGLLALQENPSVSKRHGFVFGGRGESGSSEEDANEEEDVRGSLGWVGSS